ncbi:class I SAM-dependent methyltransferase [Pedobacter aquatilis]|uniref:class I SAM-dependent methyltransferase n=1 Tax=Pedobacter aquatilis TaxID=351343 RepID=UPI0025B2A437|nr:class I SAM-dependent methyltransferase [Pedobacter aquatilis]MDN3585165.1 class I SAM-dependent methyltransferase [Pedobacter aquatilis]
MANNYDKIATQYDALSRLIFAKAQVNAQINQLNYIPANSSILIAGGGTGWILEELSKVHSSGLKIVYVELSAKMILLSQARNCKNNIVEFVNLPIEEFSTDNSFDIILTPFLFDNFTSKQAELVFFQLNHLLKDNGKWFLVDFTLEHHTGRWWKALLLKSMYLFFRFFRMIQTSHLIEMKPYFFNHHYQIIEERYYYKHFIKATIFKKKK